MATVEANLGLCSTCNNAPGCFHRARRGPALFCELFDNYASSVDRGGWRHASQSADLPGPCRPAEEDTSKYTGLCVNCGHRATCGHPRVTGGVWHCENYE